MNREDNYQLDNNVLLKNGKKTTMDQTILHNISKENLRKYLEELRSSKEELMLVYICAIDYPGRSERFEIIYHLLSVKLNERFTIKVILKEDDIMSSVSDIFPNSSWYEREIWDMYGILFKDNPDMRRILTDYGFVGHPMRKDFPLTGHIEIGYNELERNVEYSKIKLQQDFRNFDATSGWNVLHGDEKASR